MHFATALVQPTTSSAESSKVDAPLPPISLYQSQACSQVCGGCSAAAARGKESTDQGLGSSGLSFPEGTYQLKKITNFVSIIITKAFFLFRIPFYTHILIRIGFNRCIYRHSVTASKTLSKSIFGSAVFHYKRTETAHCRSRCGPEQSNHPKQRTFGNLWDLKWSFQIPWPKREVLQVTREMLLDILSTEYSVSKDSLSYKLLASCWELTSHSQSPAPMHWW